MSRKLTSEQVKLMLEKHLLWRRSNEKEGERADLSESYLIYLDAWVLVYRKEILAVHGESHTIKEWKEFDDETIVDMNPDARGWWNKWKDTIMKIIELSSGEE